MTTVLEGYMQDANGRLTPEDAVKPVDKLRDQTVRAIVTTAKAASVALAQAKAAMMGDVEAFVDLSASEYGVALGGKKGNVQLVSYDGRFKVLRAIAEHMVFDERLQVAKALIDECIQEWSQGSRDEIKVLINDAFQTDKQGKLNTARILGLRRHNINHPKWKQAMEAISDSVQVSGSKAYIRVYEKQEDGSYRQLGLDMAAV